MPALLHSLTLSTAAEGAAPSVHEHRGVAALVNPETSVLIRKCHPYLGNLNLEKQGTVESQNLRCTSGHTCPWEQGLPPWLDPQCLGAQAWHS